MVQYLLVPQPEKALKLTQLFQQVCRMLMQKTFWCPEQREIFTLRMLLLLFFKPQYLLSSFLIVIYGRCFVFVKVPVGNTIQAFHLAVPLVHSWVQLSPLAALLAQV